MRNIYLTWREVVKLLFGKSIKRQDLTIRR